jgi:hypothetical protein
MSTVKILLAILIGQCSAALIAVVISSGARLISTRRYATAAAWFFVAA